MTHVLYTGINFHFDPGQVMIYQLADHIQCFLTEHNQPPSKSFHEEMMKNLQRQQEKIALEEQRRIQEIQMKEEQMVSWKFFLSCSSFLDFVRL